MAMSPERKQLLDVIVTPDKAFGMTYDELKPLRLKAAQQVFEERVEQIPLLKHRAEEAGITKIETFADLVPLLFAHSVYKSYPQSWVEKGRWKQMLQWLDSLSVEDVTHVDVSNVKDVDDWMDALWAADHRVLATSGSSGKCSFLNHTPEDNEIKRRHFAYGTTWPYAIASKTRPVFWTGHIEGYNSQVEAGKFAKMDWAREGEMYVLASGRLRIAEISKMAAMQTKMANGTATPDEMSEFEADAAKRREQGQEDMRRFADAVLDHRHEPIYILGFWAQHLAIKERARERGIPDGDFHPDSIVKAGGGVKSIPLPDDYRAQVDAFYGDVIRPGVYAMTELIQGLPRCEANCYHIPPGLIALLLDETGEQLLNPDELDGSVREGRFGFLDIAFQGRWGGLITGDKVSMDFSPTCKCGRPGPVVLDSIVRFTRPGEEDKITCAGTIDAYIRGTV